MQRTLLGLLAAIFLSGLAVPALAGRLEDFKNEIKDEKNKPDGKKTSSSGSDTSTTSSSTNSSGSEIWGEIFFGLFKAVGYGVYLLCDWNSRQLYPRVPYADPLPYNWHVTPSKRLLDAVESNAGWSAALEDRKRWRLSGMVEWRRYDAVTTDIAAQLDLSFAGLLKLRLDIDTFEEKNEAGRWDTLNWTRFLFGMDLLSWDGFSLDFVLGWQHVGDVDATFFNWGFNARLFPGRPVVMDFSYLHGQYMGVETEEYAARLGFVVNALALHEIGIGYSQVTLGRTKPMEAATLYVRWWM